MLDWLTISITMAGGLAIFLYGMNMMSDGVNKSAGKKLRHLLQVFTKNRFASLLTGTITTSIVQSSSAVSVMVISLVKAEVMKFPQTFGILLGAGIGTTITAQIIAFKIADYALLIVALGFFINLLFSKQIFKVIGSALMGFGLLFYGLHLMSQAMSPLRDYQPFIELLLQLEKPWAGVLAGLVFTAIIQSSSAFIGIIIVLASQGLLSLESGVALLLGSNMGTTVTAIIAGMNAGQDSKRVATAFFMIKLIGVLIVIWWIPYYSKLVEYISVGISGSGEIPLPRLIANAHTVFNVMVTIILLPFSNILSALIIKIMPDKALAKKEPIQTKFLDDRLISNPAIALSLTKKEVIHMGGYVILMLKDVIVPIIQKNPSTLDVIKQNELKVDHLRKKIAIYITSISQQQIDPSLIEESFMILYINAEIEEIADVVSNILVQKSEEWLESEKEFSKEGKNEIMEFHQQTISQLEKTLEVIDTLDKNLASKIKNEHKKFRQMADVLKHRHFERLSQNITESVKTSKLHMEIMGSLRIVHSHIANIMRIITQNYN